MKNDGIPLASEQIEHLIESAELAASNAYARYSGFRVGAAILLTNGSIVTGVNVENASFGLTLCAERTAVVRAVSEHGPSIRIQALAVANLNSAPSSPCGACRQVLAEFVAPDAQIFFPFGDKIESKAFIDLLPFPFGLAEPL